MKQTTHAVLVGYSDRTGKSSGKPYTLLSFSAEGSVFEAFDRDGSGFNGEREALDKGEVIPCTLDLDVSPGQGMASATLAVTKFAVRK